MTQQRPWISDEGYELMMELARVLANKVPDANFNMQLFVGEYDEEGDVNDNYSALGDLEEFKCGTAGCAMGHAAWLFKDRISIRYAAWFVDGARVGNGFEAARKLFGTSTPDTNALFGASNEDRKQVAEKLYHFAQTGELPCPTE